MYSVLRKLRRGAARADPAGSVEPHFRNSTGESSEKYPCSIDPESAMGLNRGMGRCSSCYSIVTKNDARCYVCGDPIPQYVSAVAKRKQLSLFHNVLFTASLGFSLFCFLSDHKLSLTMSLAVSAMLLLLRLIADQCAR